MMLRFADILSKYQHDLDLDTAFSYTLRALCHQEAIREAVPVQKPRVTLEECWAAKAKQQEMEPAPSPEEVEKYLQERKERKESLARQIKAVRSIADMWHPETPGGKDFRAAVASLEKLAQEEANG
jgi:hypothetical protein